jgi:hypothetical protein
MMLSAMPREMDRPEADPASAMAPVPEVEVPLDFLVSALNRAVVRKQAVETIETKYPT